jgi:hypothetical protein
MRIIANREFGNDLAISSCHWRVGTEAARVDHRTAHAQGGGQASQGQRLLACQGAHARRRPTLHPHRPVHPLCPDGSHPVDEVAAAPVDERAVVMASQCKGRFTRAFASGSQGFRLEAGIIVHRNTSVYINIHPVELRLGMNIEVHSGSIRLTYSQIEPTYT